MEACSEIQKHPAVTCGVLSRLADNAEQSGFVLEFLVFLTESLNAAIAAGVILFEAARHHR